MPTISELGKFIFPLTKPDSDRDRPVVNGTGILCTVDQQIYVATAAHVLDQSDDRTIYMPDGVVLEAAKTEVVSTSLPASGRRGDDKIDVAVFRLTDTQLAGLTAKGYVPVPVGSWDVDDRHALGKSYVFTGFPDSRTKYIHSRRVMGLGGVTVNCTSVNPAELEALGFHYASHIGGRYDRERMAEPDGTRINAPEPWGMSGGAVWTIRPGTDEYALVGVGISYHAAQHLLVGTRLGAVVALLHSKFPETVPYVRACRTCRFEIGAAGAASGFVTPA